MFYPANAPVPELLQTDEFLLRPLRSTDVALDYDARKGSSLHSGLGPGKQVNLTDMRRARGAAPFTEI